jgi:hypothetical protein
MGEPGKAQRRPGMAQSVLLKQAPRVSWVPANLGALAVLRRLHHWEDLAAKQASCTIGPSASKETLKQFQKNPPHVSIGHSVGRLAVAFLLFDCWSREAGLDILNCASSCLFARRSRRACETQPLFDSLSTSLCLSAIPYSLFQRRV